MTEYRTILTTDDLDNFVNSISEYPTLYFPTNRIIYATRKGDKITFKGMFIITIARIKNIEVEKTTIQMKTRLIFPFYFITIFLLIFLSMFLFADKVTINGNTDPSFTERLGFVIIGLMIFSVLAGMFIRLKSDFVKGVERELELIKTTANNT